MHSRGNPPGAAPASRPLGLWPFLAAALALRLPAVLFAHGYEFVDQQFQYVDAAWHLASGDDWLRTWDYSAGLRSWVYPWLLAAMFRLTDGLGLADPLARMAAIRGLHAVVSLLPVAAFWLTVVRWRPVPNPRPVLLLFAASGAVVFAAVQPSGPTFAANLSVAAVLLFTGPGRWPPLLAGVLLGLAFCARFQDAAFGPVLLGAALATRRFAAAGLLILGCLGPLLLQGLADQATYGRFFSSPFTYFRVNFVEGAAGRFATHPWWFYLLLVGLPLTLCVPPFLGACWRVLRAGFAVLPLPMVAAAVYVALHSAVARKSVRFLVPAVILAVAGMAVGLFDARRDRWTDVLYRRLQVALHLLLLGFFSVWFFHRGPVLAARSLAAEPRFDGELLVVDSTPTGSGGAYYLRRPHLSITAMARAELAAWLRKAPTKDPRFLMVARAPLEPESLTEFGDLTLLGRFGDLVDSRSRDRRFLYRLEPRRVGR